MEKTRFITFAYPSIKRSKVYKTRIPVVKEYVAQGERFFLHRNMVLTDEGVTWKKGYSVTHTATGLGAVTADFKDKLTSIKKADGYVEEVLGSIPNLKEVIRTSTKSLHLNRDIDELIQLDIL